MAINPFKNFQRKSNSQSPSEIGFDERYSSSAKRLINRDGSFNIDRRHTSARNLYEILIGKSWMFLFAIMFIFYFIINGVFALGFYFLGVEHMRGASQGDFWHEFGQCFFFSIQAFTTVGFGFLSPIGIATNFLASLVAFTGLITFAIATGIFFAKFAKPRSHIVYSEDVLIAPNKDGHRSLQFRIANGTDSQIINLNAKCTVTWIDEIDGFARRKFEVLDLELNHIALFPMNWTIVHKIDENSPLYEKDKAYLTEHAMEILVFIEGYEVTYSQIIHAKTSYTCESLVENARFHSMYTTRKDHTVFDLSKLNDHEPYQFEDA